MILQSVLGVACLVLISAKHSESSILFFNPEKEVQVKDALDSKIYLFAADGKKKPYSFINEFGTLVGFDVEVVNKVCNLVGKKCHTVLAEFTECIFTDRSIDYAGRGLMANWFDGCPGYEITTDRQNEFDFTSPYLDSTASFTVAPGNPSRFNPDSNDYSKFTILHLTGAPTNEPCLRRLHKKYGQILVAQDLPEAKALLLNRTADVLFSPRMKIDGLQVLPQRVRCDIGGAGIMLKKGSTVPTWWNPAFQTFYLSGEYTKLCTDSSKKYGAPINCLPPPQEANPELLALINAQQPSDVPDKLWKFVVSGRIAPYSYLDEQGRLVGFTKDMLETVCQKAGKACTLLLAEVSECTVRKGELLYPGRGLMEGWFDACTGYFDTFDRENSWDFSSPYLVSYGSFFVAAGNPSGFNPDAADYSLYTIVYTETAITNAHCLNRLHKRYSRLLVVPDRPDAIAMLLNGTADAWFTKDDGAQGIERLPQELHCENVGTSIMTRKGGELPVWWNKAFGDFYSSGEYNAFCLEKGKQYNNTFPCLPPPKSLVGNGKSHQLKEGF
ncbi:unnamed protein product [Lymnaea stagnalis]|uniref:Solute-binding protein family 3/N-terminal domain-containing protein n=1 Tax=Lymnaea stagnalis TaxID=6523 RepID=A0AAV2HFW4_LYMST